MVFDEFPGHLFIKISTFPESNQYFPEYFDVWLTEQIRDAVFICQCKTISICSDPQISRISFYINGKDIPFNESQRIHNLYTLLF